VSTNRNNLVVRLNLPDIRYPAGCKVEVYAQAVRGLTEPEPDPEQQLIGSVLSQTTSQYGSRLTRTIFSWVAG